MFKARNKITGDIETVYSVNKDYVLEFLVYMDNRWIWVRASNYEPVEE